MAEMNMKTLGLAVLLVVILAVSVLIGVVIVDETGNAMKTKTVVGNESLTLVPNVTSTLTNDEIVSGTFVLYNDSELTVVVPNTEYLLHLGSGSVTMIDNNTYGNGGFNAAYTYLADNDVSTTATVFSTGIKLFATFIAIISLVMLGAGIIKQLKGGFGNKE